MKSTYTHYPLSMTFWLSCKGLRFSPRSMFAIPSTEYAYSLTQKALQPFALVMGLFSIESSLSDYVTGRLPFSDTSMRFFSISSTSVAQLISMIFSYIHQICLCISSMSRRYLQASARLVCKSTLRRVNLVSYCEIANMVEQYHEINQIV